MEVRRCYRRRFSGARKFIIDFKKILRVSIGMSGSEFSDYEDDLNEYITEDNVVSVVQKLWTLLQVRLVA